MRKAEQHTELKSDTSREIEGAGIVVEYARIILSPEISTWKI